MYSCFTKDNSYAKITEYTKNQETLRLLQISSKTLKLHTNYIYELPPIHGGVVVKNSELRTRRLGSGSVLPFNSS